MVQASVTLNNFLHVISIRIEHPELLGLAGEL